MKEVTPSQTARLPVGFLRFPEWRARRVRLQNDYLHIHAWSSSSCLSWDILLKEGTQGSTTDPTSACRLSPDQQLAWQHVFKNPWVIDHLRVDGKRILEISSLPDTHDVHQGSTCLYIYWRLARTLLSTSEPQVLLIVTKTLISLLRTSSGTWHSVEFYPLFQVSEFRSHKSTIMARWNKFKSVEWKMTFSSYQSSSEINIYTSVCRF